MNRFGIDASEGRFFQSLRSRLWKYADRVVAYIYNYFKFETKPIDNHKIMMLTSRGSYNCNPKAVAEEILRQKLPYQIIWVIRKENRMNYENYPKNVKLVQRGSYEFYQEAATSKVWIDNSVTYTYLFAHKRRQQVLFETWHGSFGLKKFDETVNNNKYWIKKAYQEGRMTDYCLTNCKFEEELFRSTFWKNAEMLPYGHPRNDMLFYPDSKENRALQESIRKKYHLGKDTHVLLYAPTYREQSGTALVELAYDDVAQALEKRFGGKWVIMVRYHFLDRFYSNLDKSNPNILDVTSYPDIQDLMLVADIGLTDYSSWIYDYFFTKKPGFLYVPDIDIYTEKDREFLFPIEITPFPIGKTNKALCEKILNFDEKRYEKDYQVFYDKMQCYEEGHASERLVEKLKEIMN